MPRVYYSKCPIHQVDGVRSGALASTVLDEWKDEVTSVALGFQKNVRIISVAFSITWTVQPDPVEVIVTVDGVSITHVQSNPVSATSYEAAILAMAAANAQIFAGISQYRAFLYEGRSVKVQVRRTGGTVSDVSLRVKWAKIP